MKHLAAVLAVLTLLPAAVSADASQDALRAVELAPCALSVRANAQAYAETKLSLTKIKARLFSLQESGRIDYYRFQDLVSRLSDLAWRADGYFRAVRELETGSKFASVARRDELRGQFRQALDRFLAKMPR